MKFLSALLVVATAWSGLVEGVKIMPFGDSITELGCWRAMLWQQLRSAGYTNIDFVGTGRSNTNCNIQYDNDHEGHSGFLATDIADKNQLVGWLASAKPDIVTMHLGTNDMYNSKTTQQIIAAYTKMVGQMRASNPNMKIIVAKIIPINLSWCNVCSANVNALNNAIPAWAAGLSTTASPITVVDQYTGFNPATDLPDGLHPNAAGDAKMAKVWYPAVVAALGGSGGTNPTPTTSPPASTSSPGTVGTPWGQCGGIGWTGPTACPSGYTCKVSNAYYSQCVPA